MAQLEIIFCDIYKRFIDACTDEIKNNEHLQQHFKFATYFGDIRDLQVPINTAYLSPANSFCSMFGGIDLIYCQEMFPNIHEVVMEKVSKLKTKTTLRRSFDNLGKGTIRSILPVGQAMLTPLTEYEKYETCYLLSAPTMEYPMDISHTDNPYQAFLASLKIIAENKDKNITTLVVPGLGTGIGGFDPEESAKQIFMALNHFINLKN